MGGQIRQLFRGQPAFHFLINTHGQGPLPSLVGPGAGKVVREASSCRGLVLEREVVVFLLNAKVCLAIYFLLSEYRFTSALCVCMAKCERSF